MVFWGCRYALRLSNWRPFGAGCRFARVGLFIPVGHRTGAPLGLVVAARCYLLRCVGSRWSGRSALQPCGLWSGLRPLLPIPQPRLCAPLRRLCRLLDAKKWAVKNRRTA
ncbi:hypothetical protein SGRA_0624 [Saprospira grandis str. Lewin]|uniref:Uncharacterized protein n=1 Tax=Saprospira grandis (strain Lewin) TaxID=984262 RepID=H6L0D3_SAPGL|nr:hypothetical protein SGRA_0624 [Saprospira grandis str. Lewin]